MDPDHSDRRSHDGFYVLKDTCLGCALPVDAWAPDLMEMKDGVCCFRRQPTTADEVARACEAAMNSCPRAIRFGGIDPAVIRMLDNNPCICDHILDSKGRVRRVYLLD